jgi:uncharacterized phiE125 gp8 family phage protein
MTIEEMRELLGLGPEVSDEDVVDAYGAFIDGPAVAAILPLTDVKAQLRVEADDEDELIAGLILVAVEAIEGETGHLFTARPVTEYFSSFAQVRLRSWPINSITGISYFEPGGATAVFDPALLRLSLAGRPARLVRIATAFPLTSGERDSVGVTINAGYADPLEVPHRLRQAAMLMIADLYAQRETFVNGTISSAVQMSLTVNRLIDPFRILSI